MKTGVDSEKVTKHVLAAWFLTSCEDLRFVSENSEPLCIDLKAENIHSMLFTEKKFKPSQAQCDTCFTYLIVE